MLDGADSDAVGPPPRHEYTRAITRLRGEGGQGLAPCARRHRGADLLRAAAGCVRRRGDGKSRAQRAADLAARRRRARCATTSSGCSSQRVGPTVLRTRPISPSASTCVALRWRRSRRRGKRGRHRQTADRVPRRGLFAPLRASRGHRVARGRRARASRSPQSRGRGGATAERRRPVARPARQAAADMPERSPTVRGSRCART